MKSWFRTYRRKEATPCAVNKRRRNSAGTSNRQPPKCVHVRQPGQVFLNPDDEYKPYVTLSFSSKSMFF